MRFLPLTVVNIKEFYRETGGDYDEVVTRLQSDAVITKFVKKLASDDSVENLKKAQAENDVKTAFLAAHTIKGVAATLGMTGLANAASLLTEELRPLREMPDRSFFDGVYSAYERIIGLIPALN